MSPQCSGCWFALGLYRDRGRGEVGPSRGVRQARLFPHRRKLWKIRRDGRGRDFKSARARHSCFKHLLVINPWKKSEFTVSETPLALELSSYDLPVYNYTRSITEANVLYYSVGYDYSTSHVLTSTRSQNQKFEKFVQKVGPHPRTISNIDEHVCTLRKTALTARGIERSELWYLVCVDLLLLHSAVDSVVSATLKGNTPKPDFNTGEIRSTWISTV